MVDEVEALPAFANGRTLLLAMNGIILDLIALALPVLAAICAARYWRGTMRLAIGIAIVSLPFTPAWDAAWTLLTQSWHGEQAMAEPEVLPVGIKRLSAADLWPDILASDTDGSSPSP